MGEGLGDVEDLLAPETGHVEQDAAADHAVLGGVDEAIAVLRECAGLVHEEGAWEPGWDDLVVHALFDGDEIEPWESVLTIEGLAPSADKLHPMQEAFRENHALQCGFCTPGMVMSAIDMVKRHNYQLDEATVRRELEGNLCRCTGYHNIVKAILAAAPAMKAAGV